MSENKSAISLKKIEEKAPELISLAKKASISLSKLNLSDVRARVVLVLDASGSMHERYRGGAVQEIVNRVVPIAVNFDDNASIDLYAFGEKPVHLDDVTLDNYKGTVEGKWKEWDVGRLINNEIDTMKLIVNDHVKEGSELPTYVIFVSDGGVGSKSEMKSLIKEVSGQGIFWQFMGIGGRNYGALEDLDTMEGRVVDNANFFALDALSDMADEELYESLLTEFPDWLREAKQAGILDQDGRVIPKSIPKYAVASGAGVHRQDSNSSEEAKSGGIFSSLKKFFK